VLLLSHTLSAVVGSLYLLQLLIQLHGLAFVSRVIAVAHVIPLAVAVPPIIARAALSPRCRAYSALISPCRFNFSRAEWDFSTLDLIHYFSHFIF
jgi:hypothetical protein